MRVLWLAGSVLLLSGGTIHTAAGTEEPPLVSGDADGNLSYRVDGRGNRVPDFSPVGYRYGLDPVLPPGLPELSLDPPPPGVSARSLIQDALVAPKQSGNGEYESPGVHVEPEPLYEAQGRARYGPRPNRALALPPTPAPYAIGLCTPLVDAIVDNLGGVCEGTADVCEAKADLAGESCDEWCDRAGLVCASAWEKPEAAATNGTSSSSSSDNDPSNHEEEEKSAAKTEGKKKGKPATKDDSTFSSGSSSDSSDGTQCQRGESIGCGKKGNNQSICRCENAPTSSPTSSPTVPPTANPTQAPTPDPTAPPTEFPTNAPTPSPTPLPTAFPNPAPTYPLCTPLLYPDDLIVGDEVCKNNADVCQATADLGKNGQESCDAWCNRGGYECVRAWDDGEEDCKRKGRTSCGKQGNNESICRCERRDPARDRLCNPLRKKIWENNVCINTYEVCEAVAVLNGDSCETWCGPELQCVGAWNDKRATAEFPTSCRRKKKISCKTKGESRSICRCGQACPAILAPVCGADGIVYSNDCEAKRAGNASWTEIEDLSVIPGTRCDPKQGPTEKYLELFN